MKNGVFVSIPVLLIVGFSALPVVSAQTLVGFEGGIGVTPVSGNAPPFTANVVRGVNPSGHPWVIRHLVASVTTNGDIRVTGEGLIRAGGKIGTTSEDPIFATLFCGNVAHHSGAILPEPNGDFTIEDMLDPAPPDPCDNPVLLIRSVGPDPMPGIGNWLAAGIPKE